MKIGVLAQSASKESAGLVLAIEKISGCACPVFDISDSSGSTVQLDQTGVVWNGSHLQEFDKLVILGFEYQDPLIPRAVVSADWSIWQIDYVVDQQYYSFISSVLRDLERRGVCMVNKWDSLKYNFSKALLLSRLQESGFLLPQWLCSNEMSVVEKFCADEKQVIWRPNNGRAAWQLFLDKQRLYCVDPSKAPVLIASHPGFQLQRAFVCGTEVLMALHCSSPYAADFEYMEQVWCCDSTAVAAELAAAVAATGATWAQVLYTEIDGRPCIYDIDTDPKYGWLPLEFRNYLNHRLAEQLLEIPVTTIAPLGSTARVERDSLFVRRMLVTLHELEANKYATS
jgi:hypothetical protein